LEQVSNISFVAALFAFFVVKVCALSCVVETFPFLHFAFCFCFFIGEILAFWLW
jgi:hypothetical protein